MTHSLRRTVSVRFSLTIFGALLVIAFWAYLGTRRVLKESLDQNLVAAAQLEQAVLASRLPIALQPGPDDWNAFTQSVNRFVVVRNREGRIVETNTTSGAALPLDTAAFRRVLNGDTAWVTQDWLDGTVRSYYAPAPARSRPGHDVVQIAASMHPLQEATREVLFLMLGTVFLGAVATAIGAGWLAQSSVLPVLEITAQARSVQPGVPRRITAHADTEEFAGLVDVLNDAFERLEHAYDAQRRMITDAAHDLRTPLTVMRGEAEIALRGERTPEEYRATLCSMLEEVDQLTAISDSLILLARLEAGELVVDHAEQDVADIAEQAAAKAQLRDAARTYDFRGDQAEIYAPVDRRLLIIGLGQLLDNVAKHTPPDTRATVTVEDVGTGITVRIDDSGPGLPDETLPHLFEHFYRTDAARTRTGSVGLGLTITAAIVRAHGGDITAGRSPMGGLRIALRLPKEPVRA